MVPTLKWDIFGGWGLLRLDAKAGVYILSGSCRASIGKEDIAINEDGNCD